MVSDTEHQQMQLGSLKPPISQGGVSVHVVLALGKQIEKAKLEGGLGYMTTNME